MHSLVRTMVFLLAVLSMDRQQCHAVYAPASFVNFEIPTIHPIALSPNGRILAVCNLPDARVELFRVSAGGVTNAASIPVGLDPVTVRFRSDAELWVVNHISRTIHIIDTAALRVTAVFESSVRPADVVFAGNPKRAWVSGSLFNVVEVYDPVSLALLRSISISGDRPSALAVSPDGQKVYAAIRESGNGTTILSRALVDLDTHSRPGPLESTNGPYQGQNPPPNAGTQFRPPINPELGTNKPPPVGLIVKKMSDGRWRDDNNGDWTEFIRGTNAALSGRIPGWDLPDHDIAVIDAATYQVSYIDRLMTLCFDLAVNPADGMIAVVGTDALNHIRFEPVLKGIFTRVQLGLINPSDSVKVIKDMNPHLDYTQPSIPAAERVKSVGDPRAVIWNRSGSRCYVAGLGSNNLLVLDKNGNRLALIPLPEGPSGLALNDESGLLYVMNRFAASISVVDVETLAVKQTVPFFDPTPEPIRIGRKHLYGTHANSGLGQASCASCHPDARMDRLAWDLGDPAGKMKYLDAKAFLTHDNFPGTNHYHPMKGPMITQTLQDIIQHEPFHWRGDRAGIEDFSVTFRDLQGADAELSTAEMKELNGFLRTIYFPPNPYRTFDDHSSTNLPLPGFFASGFGNLPKGSPLPDGNALSGKSKLAGFPGATVACTTCHADPSGLPKERGVNPSDPNGNHLLELFISSRIEGLPFKVPQLRNLAEKIGLRFDSTNSTSGFGFMHDGRVDTLERFLLDGFHSTNDQQTADLIAVMLSGQIGQQDTVHTLAVPSGVGSQFNLLATNASLIVSQVMAVARFSLSGIDVVVRGEKDGIQRSWVYDRIIDRFQANRSIETLAVNDVQLLVSPTNSLLLTLVSQGSGQRIGLDRDGDGILDQDELDAGSDPANPRSVPQNRPPQFRTISDKAIFAGGRLEFTAEASDPDNAAEKLTYSLASPPRQGASIDPSSGRFVWEASGSEVRQVVTFQLRVRDAGMPPLQTSATFNVRIVASTLDITLIPPANRVRIQWVSTPGQSYFVQFTEDLKTSDWADLSGPFLGGVQNFVLNHTVSVNSTPRYFRLRLAE